MGGGASSAGSSNTKTKEAATAPGFDAGGVVPPHWLLICIEQERRDKEWLAQKYDERCSEVRLLRKQLAQARGLQGPEPSPRGPASAQAESPITQEEAPFTRMTSVGSLAERRSLTLNVQTPGGRKPPLKSAFGGGAGNAAGTGAVIPVHLPSQTADEYGEPPLDRATAVGTDSQGPSLFVRRASLKDSEEPSGQTRMPEPVSAKKVFSMVDNHDADPISPKRAVSMRKKGGAEF